MEPTTMEKETKKGAATLEQLAETPMVYTEVYCSVVKQSSKEVIMTYPDQGIPPLFVKTDKPHSFKQGDNLIASVVLDEEKSSYRFVGEPTKCSVPTPAQITESQARCETLQKKYDEIQAAIADKKKAQFFEKNQLPPIPTELYIKKTIWGMICTSVLSDIPVLLLGPKGCGKTETAKRVAQALGYNFHSFNMGAAYKPKEIFVGQVHAKENAAGHVETVLIDSEFLTAFQSKEKTLIFLDEITRTPQAAANYAMTIIDRNQNKIYIPELGKDVFRGPDVRFISAGNAGMQYTDTRTQDGAFMDRFVKFVVDYLPEEEEMKLIKSRVPAVPMKEMRELIVRAKKCREAEKSGALTTGVSTRQLLDMARFLEIGYSLNEVFDDIFLTNFINGNINDVEAVKAMIQV